MNLCENCIHWQGGLGVQKGISLCRRKNPMRYRYPDFMGDAHGYVPTGRNCFTAKEAGQSAPTPIRSCKPSAKSAHD